MSRAIRRQITVTAEAPLTHTEMYIIRVHSLRKASIFSPVAIHHINETTAKRLNTLYDELQKQGADMVVAGYPIAEYEGTPERAAYDEMGQEIADALDAAVISDFNDYRYPTSYFL